MFIHFKNENILSYKYEPIIISVQKNIYIIVPDFFREISHITFDGNEYKPSIVPEWLPVSIFKIDKTDRHVYDKFLKITTSNTKIVIDDYEEKISTEMNIYHKIIPQCRNSPRFLTFSFDIQKEIINDSFTKTMLKDNSNKLFGVYYYHEDLGKFYRFHYIPVCMIVNIITGGNKDVISLNFEKKKILKIGKCNIINSKMFNYNYKLNIFVDTNILLEGKLDDSEKVKYKGRKKNVNLPYYKITDYNEFTFKKGKQKYFSSQDGNDKLFQNYQKLF